MLSLTSELLFYTRDCLKISLKNELHFARKWLHFLPSIIQLSTLNMNDGCRYN